MFKIFKKISFHIKKYKKKYFVAIFFLLMVEFIDAIPPRVISKISDSISNGNLTRDVLYKNIGFLVAITLFSYGMGLIWTRNLWGVSDLFGRDMRNTLIEKLLKSKSKFFETHTSGDLMTNVTSDTDAVRVASGYGVMSFLDATIYPIVLFIMMIAGSGLKLSVISVIPLIILAPTVTYLSNKIEEMYDVVQNKISIINDAVLENVQGVRVIRAYSSENAQKENFKNLSMDNYRANMKLAYYENAYGFIVKFLPILSYLLGIYFGAKMMGNGEITIGNIIALQIYLGMLVWPMMSLGDFLTTVAMGNTSFDRINATLSYVEDVVESENPKKISKIDEISFRDLDFKYPSSSSNNLENIDLTIKKGMTLGIVGKTGSGKTTIIKQLLRGYKTEDKKIFINDIPIEDIDFYSLSSKIAYVPQENILFSKTIRENIMLGNSSATDEDLKKVIEITDLLPDIKVFSEGLETLAGEKGISLSGGQKQRIAIARAIITNREVLIMDDSLSAVDAATEKRIIEHINKTRNGMTNIIISHRLSAVLNADEIIVVDDGKIVERGTHEDLMKSDTWYRRQFLYQNSGGSDEKEKQKE